MHFGCRWKEMMPDIVVYVHLLPWFPVMDVYLLLSGKWFKLAGGRWDFCRDYDFVLWWYIEGCHGS
jgi:hypothetical protein